MDLDSPQPVDFDESSSFLSYCSNSDEEENVKKCTSPAVELIGSHELVLNKSVTDDLSTSDFQFQVENSLQEDQVIRRSQGNELKILNFNLKQMNMYSKNQQHQKVYDKTMDFSAMLLLLDQKDDKVQPIQNKNQQYQLKKHTQHLRTEKYQTKTYFELQKIKKNHYFHEKNYPSFPPREIPRQRINKPLKTFERKPSRFQPQFRPSQGYKTYDPNPYSSLRKPFSVGVNLIKKSEQFASQSYIFCNVLISIKLCSFMTVRKNILVAPFSSAQFNQFVPKTVMKRLKYNMKQVYQKQLTKKIEKSMRDGYVFSVKARGLQENYRGVYFMKSSQNSKESLKYYDVSVLKQGVKNIFSLLDSHCEQSVVFADFEWGVLRQNEVSELLISAIFRQISQSKKSYRCQALREVVISVNNCEGFELYSKCLTFYVSQLLA